VKILKKIFFLCFIVFVSMTVFTISSCQKEIKNLSTDTTLSDGSTGILANNKAVDFYFYYPENCILDKNAAMISVYVPDSEVVQSLTTQTPTDSTNPVDSTTESSTTSSYEGFSFPVQPNLSAIVFGLPPNKYADVEDFWDNYVLPSYEATYQNVQLDPAKPEDVTVDGAAGKKYTFTLDVAGVSFKFSQVIFFNKNQFYTLTYTSIPDKFDQYANILDTAVETFKFK